MNSPIITSIVCPTKNRKESLRLLLESFVPNLKDFGRTPDLVIMDDSPKAETRNMCRQMLRTLSRELDVNIFYGGVEEKIIFAKKLIEKNHVPPGLIKFALFDTSRSGLPSLGANRNATLLDTVGSLIVSVDDDIRYLTATSTGFTEDIAILPGHHPPEEIRVFKDREEALQSINVAPRDFLGAQENFLGKDLVDIPAVLEKNGSTHKPVQDDIQFTNSGQRVLVTTNGYVGDCGWGTPTRYFTLRGQSLKHFTRSEAAYRVGCASREVVQYVDHLTITEKTERMMGGCFGLDNRMLNPPFIPMGRGEDHIFGKMVSRYFRDAHFAYLPQIVLHAPVDPRKFWNGEITRSASGIDFPTFFGSLFDAFEQKYFGLNSQANLILLGKRFEELGQMSELDFEAYVRQDITRQAHSIISELESQVEEANHSPEYWDNDVRKFIKIKREALTQSEFIIPLDLLYGHGYQDALRLIQQMVLKYGQLLQGWPELLDITKYLSNENHQIAKLV